MLKCTTHSTNKSSMFFQIRGGNKISGLPGEILNFPFVLYGSKLIAFHKLQGRIQDSSLGACTHLGGACGHGCLLSAKNCMKMKKIQTVGGGGEGGCAGHAP